MSMDDVWLRPWEQDFTLPETFNMVSLLLERHIRDGRGQRNAILHEDGVMTYEELGALTNRFGNGLKKLGIDFGQRVILLLYDSPYFVAAFLGVMKIGAVPVPINILATSDDLAYFINDSEAVCVVVEDDLFPKLEPVLSELKNLRHVVVKGATVKGHTSLNELLETSSPSLDLYPTKKTDHSYWLYTSGTTGKPKGVIHLHKDLVYAVETWAWHVIGFKPDDVVYCVSRLFFSYGLNMGLYLPLYFGASVALLPYRPTPPQILEIVERYRPTIMFSVPTAYGLTLRHIEETGKSPDLSSLRLCVSAGEALPGPIYDRWLERFGVRVVDGIGSTEVSWVYISNRPDNIKKGSSGLPVPGYRLKIVNEDGYEAAVNEEGELWVSSYTIASGYWNKPDKTEHTFHGEWMRTGDRFYKDEDGYYFYTGRVDDALKVSGIWVSPLEVEETLMGHKAVAECAVVAHRDGMDLIKPKAFVSLKSGFAPGEDLADELKSYVKNRLAPYKYPRWVEFVDELPKTATGKIQRYKLRQRT